MVKICRNLIKKCHQQLKSSDFAVIFQSFLWHLHEHAALIRRAWEVLEIAGTVIQFEETNKYYGNFMGILMVMEIHGIYIQHYPTTCNFSL